MKNVKKVLAISMVFMLILSFLPVNVFAITNEEKANLVEIMLRQAENITINGNTALIEYNGGYISVTGNDLQYYNNENWNYGDHVGSLLFLYTSSTSLTFTATNVTEGFVPQIWVDGQPNQLENNEYTVNNLKKSSEVEQPYSFEFTFEDRRYDNGEGPRYEYDGNSVYFVWSTAENNFYYHKITGIVGRNNSQNVAEYEINYIPLSTVTADNASGVKYSMANRTRRVTQPDGRVDEINNYEFVWTAGLDAAIVDENFALLTANEKFDYMHENGMTVDPTGAIYGENSISTNGDRNFRLTIYDDTENVYEGMQLGVPTNYEYYPAFWDRAFHSDVMDISGTTKDNPAFCEAFLLEKTLRISASDYSRSFKEVKALNVPNKAVTIANASNGKFDITFNSNYYDTVEFEITDLNNQKYYIMISRINIQLKMQEKYAAIYYPASDSYNDYAVVVNLKYNDGKEQTIVAEEANKGIESEGGDLYTKYEIEGGENLKTAWFVLPDFDRENVSSFALTIVKKSASTSKNYGGTLAGSNSGIEFRNDGRGFSRVYTY